MRVVKRVMSDAQPRPNATPRARPRRDVPTRPVELGWTQSARSRERPRPKPRVCGQGCTR